MERERGSATIETVGSIVSLTLFAAVILQIVLVLDAYLVAGHATREGAHAAAVGAGQTEVQALVAQIADVPVATAQVQVTPNSRNAGDLVTVTFTAEVMRLPVLAAILPPLEITADSTARAEVST